MQTQPIAVQPIVTGAVAPASTQPPSARSSRCTSTTSLKSPRKRFSAKSSSSRAVQLSLAFESSEAEAPQEIIGASEPVPVTSSTAYPAWSKTLERKAEIWRLWNDWWRTSKCQDPIRSVDGIERFARHVEATVRTPHRIHKIFCVIREWLAGDGQHDPQALMLVDQVNMAAWHAHKRDTRGAKVSIFGRTEIDRLVQSADPLSPKDARDLSALLVLYDTMASPNHIFGHYTNGRFQTSPIRRDAVSFQDDGTATLEIPAIDLLQSRSVALSVQTTWWLRVWLDSRTDQSPEMFIVRGGPLHFFAWRSSIDDLTRRAGFLSPSIRGLRRGRMLESFAGGARIEEVRQASTWRSLDPLYRTRSAMTRGSRRVGLDAAPPSLGRSKRRATRMRAYCRDLFLGSG